MAEMEGKNLSEQFLDIDSDSVTCILQKNNTHPCEVSVNNDYLMFVLVFAGLAVKVPLPTFIAELAD